MSAIFTMDQYAGFVWAAYGISVLVLAAAVIWCVRGYAQAKAEVSALEELAS